MLNNSYVTWQLPLRLYGLPILPFSNYQPSLAVYLQLPYCHQVCVFVWFSLHLHLQNVVPKIHSKHSNATTQGPSLNNSSLSWYLFPRMLIIKTWAFIFCAPIFGNPLRPEGTTITQKMLLNPKIQLRNNYFYHY